MTKFWEVKLKRETQDFFDSLVPAIAMHIDENYPTLEEHEVEALEEKLINVMDRGLESAWERAE